MINNGGNNYCHCYDQSKQQRRTYTVIGHPRHPNIARHPERSEGSPGLAQCRIQEILRYAQDDGRGATFYLIISIRGTSNCIRL
ncbi:hypothetical protein BN59_02034 [Legionella massiliensis]|uniref:Uncharacterized protein n=1 Tax=Legionella massiliensis TaxID=1034943 RepID=A0A078L118_9GAMM|nr:hypothetical protein BN59_02034 [Legionella massiliensis]CEE13482.1 hypothetical protein BN1094_02034 [Legionella massiliensis]